jgi:abortive infection bacteriophage resistance protein
MSQEIHPEVNVEKPKYMFMSHCQTAKQNQSMEAPNKSFENVTKLYYFGNKIKT